MNRTNGATTDLATIEPRHRDLIQREEAMGFAEMKEMANEVSKSGCFKSGKNAMSPSEVLVLMMLARARGFPMIEGVMRYDIIQNTPAMKAKCLLAEFQSAGGKVEWLESTDKICRARFSHPTHHPKPFDVEISFADLESKGITRGYDGKTKTNWMNWPAAMLRARAESAGVNAILPGVAMGIPVAEEVDIIDVTATPATETHAKLNDQLKARLTKPAPAEPVVDVPSTPVAPKPPAEPATEWGKVIKDRVDLYNSERAIYSASEPERDDLKKPLHPNQVMNHTANTALGETRVLAGELNVDGDPKGKRDKGRVARFLSDVWASDQEAIYEIVDDYLDELFKGLGFEANAFAKHQEVPA